MTPAEIMAKWEKHEGEFSSYQEFLEGGIKKSQWGRRTWGKLRRKTAGVC